MYTELEMQDIIRRSHHVSGILRYLDGEIITRISHTVNYYRRGIDGLWYNYDCKTVY